MINPCLVQGRVIRANGAAVVGAVVAWRLDKVPGQVVFAGASALSVDDELIACTDGNGAWALNLPRNARMVVRVQELDLYRQVLIPDQPTATFEEVLNAGI